ncbi:hypothetical protein B5X24_HaOG214981 [Helicoverpa armigera]|nr:hypothetical protein B5X24_HaOG214981 [Helicoverpa armigera]
MMALVVQKIRKSPTMEGVLVWPKRKKAPLKTFEEIQPLIQQSRKRELKLLIRENSWPINSPVRASLWPALCRQHQHGKSMLDGFYWDMVTQVKPHARWTRAKS